ncbi:MAG: hypothetical protein A2X08_02970 [Bacteroidetes bacterium GWA2_32_17]|nr:MAG: hypothetical protein A2X08_02970 [Bacteroidetes bacterium GWA2_32_17]
MKNISIIKAEYVCDYKVRLTFNDEKVNVVDFEYYVMKQKNPDYQKYKKLNEFKKFKIEEDNIVWGKNWDLCFHIHKLYDNTLTKIKNCGRKPVADKKVCVRLYVLQSVIDAKGGMEAVQENATKFVNSKNEKIGNKNT